MNRIKHQAVVDRESYPAGRVWAAELDYDFVCSTADRFNADVSQYGCLDAYDFVPAGSMARTSHGDIIQRWAYGQ